MVLVAWVCLVPLYGRAQPPDLPQTPPRVRAGLAQLHALVEGKAYEEAVDQIRTLMEEDGETLVEAPIDAATAQLGFRRYWPARRLLQMRLLAWHGSSPPLLEHYRAQVDSTARAYLREAHTQRDPRRLELIVRRYLASSVGAQACWKLGEAALQQGRFLTALQAWEKLEPAARTPGGQPAWLALERLEEDQLREALVSLQEQPADKRLWSVLAESPYAASHVRGRLALRALIAGQTRAAHMWARATEVTNPSPPETVFGREAPWSEHLKRWLTDAATWPRDYQRSWPTFGGSAQRAAHLPEIDWTGQLLWVEPLPRLSLRRSVGRETTVPVGGNWELPTSYFPVAFHENVWWMDIRGWHRRPLLGTRRSTMTASGSEEQAAESQLVWELPGQWKQALENASLYEGIPQFELAVDETFVAGTSRDVGFAENDARLIDRGSALTVWNVRADRLHWTRAAEEGWFFSGPPLIDGGRIFAVQRRQSRLQASWRIVAFDLSNGRPLWRQEIGRSRDSQSPWLWTADRLTLIEDYLCLVTHAGIVVCLDSRDGTFRWVLEYPRQAPPAARPDAVLPRHIFRRGTPAMTCGELLLVAPADSDRLFAVDLLEGTLVWATAPGVASDVRHLLGVVGDHAIVSGDRLYWLEWTTGRVRRAFPEGGSNEEGEGLPHPRGVGRGLIAGNTIWWPTAERIWRFDGESPQMQADPIELRLWGLSGGNLLWHGGILMLASGDRLAAFAAPPVEATRPAGATR